MSASRLYNDPAANYDDPALPPPPLVSRLQPVSFTAAMAPEGVAFRPVPLAFPQHADPTAPAPAPAAAAAAAASVDGGRSARFSTTSLESLSRFADQDASRMGMSGAESFRFTLRDTRGPMALHPHAHHPRPQPQPQPQPQALSHPNGATSGAAPPGYLSARQSARLPPSRFFYHFNHTNAMLADNARLRERPTGRTVIITPTVLPRVQEPRLYPLRTLTYHHPQQPQLQSQPLQQWQQWQQGAAPLVTVQPAVGIAAGTAVLFPHAYNPGESESARAHAFDLSGRGAPLAPPVYDSFPLHPQQRLFRPAASPSASAHQTRRPCADGSCGPLVPPPAPVLALDPRTHRYVPAFSESADHRVNRLALDTTSCY